MMKFYCRYVDDTLVLIQKDQIQYGLNLFNSFDKHLQFTDDTFDNGNFNFLDIKILNNAEVDIYAKDTNIGLYVQYNSYEHSNTKPTWIHSLYDRAQEICSSQKILMTHVNCFKKLISLNSHPHFLRKKIIM